ncbi:MAG: sodium:solute symporter family protein, partial [Selenomonadales bacterium]|nr:sodium:solute symporter family protein [Selenomonadales bacterium]
MNEMDMDLMFYVSLCVTLIIVVGAGIYATRMVKSAEDYSVGGHRASGAIVTGALIGTLIGGAATIGTAQLAFCVGISAWWFTLGLGVGLVVLALFYAAPLRKQKMVTI